MSSTFSDKGLVLRRSTVDEDDVRTTILLKNHGKVTALTKGARRSQAKLKNLLEPFTEAEYQLFLPGHSTHGRIITGVLGHSNSGIRMNISSFSTACRMAEVMDLLVPQRMPSPDLFDILRLSFRWLDRAQLSSTVWIFFATRLLHNLGYGDSWTVLKFPVTESERENIEKFLSYRADEAEPVLPPLSISLMDRWSSSIDTTLGDLLPRELKSSVLA